MRTGKLRHRVEIQRFTEKKDEWGNWVEAWETLAIVWAAIEPMKGEEYLAAMAFQSEITHKVTMRYFGEGITTKDLLVFNDRTFEIESIINVEERNRELVLMCKEKVGKDGSG